MDTQTGGELEHRVGALEREVERLRSLVEGGDTTSVETAPDAATPQIPEASEDPLWLVNTLARHAPGVVMMAGVVEVPAGPIRWQYGLRAEDLLDRDWSEFARPVEALGHPVRLELVRRILTGTQTTAELRARPVRLHWSAVSPPAPARQRRLARLASSRTLRGPCSADRSPPCSDHDRRELGAVQQ